MYAFFSGVLAEKDKDGIVMECGGVGYRLQCGYNTIHSLPQIGQTCKVYAYLSVRDDAQELFGFSSIDEKNMFLRLIGVSGIGPRTAIGIVSSMPISELAAAILTGDIAALSRAPGVGKKTAQRMALELKDKLAGEFYSGSQTQAQPEADGVIQQSIAALMSLGYTAGEAINAVNAVPDKTAGVNEIIKMALRQAGRQQ